MKYLLQEISNGQATFTLNREEIHNAFNDILIQELTEAFESIQKKDEIKLIILTGKGKSFCAGADLNWMSSMINYSMQENIEDSKKLAKLFMTINDCKIPVLGKVNGAALGGGVGLLAVCDYVITHEKAKFGFTETKLGLVPAVISPYCINKIGESNARAWFISGEKFDAFKALQMNLVHEVVSIDRFESRTLELINSFLTAAPNAMKEAKSLVKNILNRLDQTDFTVNTIAKLRVSKEGQEGMSALLEKRNANWMEK